MKNVIPSLRPAVLKTAAAAFVSLSAALAYAQDTHTILPLPPPSVSTVPSNGDVNPYGVAFVPKTVLAGTGLQPGDILVSNFNNSANLQGKGTTILRVSAAGNVSTLFTGSSTQSGLTAAIGVLSNGFVLIGNLPTADGTPNTVKPGSLSVLDGAGVFLGTIGTLSTVDGPWGMAVYDTGSAGSGAAHVCVPSMFESSKVKVLFTT